MLIHFPGHAGAIFTLLFTYLRFLYYASTTTWTIGLLCQIELYRATRLCLWFLSFGSLLVLTSILWLQSERGWVHPKQPFNTLGSFCASYGPLDLDSRCSLGC